MLWRLICFKRGGKNSKRENSKKVVMKRRYSERSTGFIVRRAMANVVPVKVLKITRRLNLVVSRLGLDPRALTLKGLIRLLGLNMTENDEERQYSDQDWLFVLLDGD